MSLLLGSACNPDSSAPDPLEGLSRVDPLGCLIPKGAGAPPLLKLTQVLSGLGRPVDLVFAPDGSGRIFVVDQEGFIRVTKSLPNDTPEVFLDLSSRVYFGGESGLLSMAFDPRFVENGRFYVYYTREKGTEVEAIVRRFQVTAPPLGPVDKTQEEILLRIDKPYFNHNGGQLAFGPDKALYISTGDGGGAADPLDAGQDLGSLLGKILRISVNQAPGYRVPSDNPFVTTPGARPEIWAYGLRNPWRFSFDPVEGTLWAGDVGQDEEEEIDIIEKGGNYGWSIREGSRCFRPMEGCRTQGLIDPVHSYGRNDGQSVTGGRVYRGKAIPGLYGTYVFADFATPSLFGLTLGGDGSYVRSSLAQVDINISAIGSDPDGELYVLDWATGRAFRLELADPGTPGSLGWPATLSATGCFADLNRRELAKGVLRYDVNVPLWSDGAVKERGLALPKGGLIGYSKTGSWELPEGTMLIKTFVRDNAPLETRLLYKDGASFRGATYRWNVERTDATLLFGSVQTDPDLPLQKGWYFPSRADCQRCHTQVARQVLGLNAGQWNREADLLSLGKPVSQIAALSRLGYFQNPPSASQIPAALATTGERAARAYLHVNCASCHQPMAQANLTLDLRFDTPLEEMGACGVRPQAGDDGIANALLIAPSEPERSLLYLRMHSRKKGFAMPPVSSLEVDEGGSQLVRSWIGGLRTCGQ